MTRFVARCCGGICFKFIINKLIIPPFVNISSLFYHQSGLSHVSKIYHSDKLLSKVFKYCIQLLQMDRSMISMKHPTFNKNL